MSQLICKNLLVGYEGKAILDHLNFEIHAGDYLCVVGENGAGKSTLMKTLLGVQHPVRLYLDSDPDKIGSLALHRAFHHRGRSVYAVLQQDLCSHL